MWVLKKSARFKNQLIYFAKGYNEDAGSEIAERFVDAVEDAIEFIQKQPLGCRIYHEAHNYPQLRHYEFRKWSVKGFPHSLFFRFCDDETILLEAIYAHRMNTIKHFPFDTRS